MHSSSEAASPPFGRCDARPDAPPGNGDESGIPDNPGAFPTVGPFRMPWRLPAFAVSSGAVPSTLRAEATPRSDAEPVALNAFARGGRAGGSGAPGQRGPQGPHGPILRRLVSYLRPVWVLIAVSLFLTLISSALGQIPQLVNRYLIDRVLLSTHRVPHPIRVLVTIAIALFVLRLVLAGVAFGRSYTMRIVGQSLVYRLRRDVFRRVQYLSTDFYIQTGVGQIMSRVMNDTGQVQNFITSNLSTMLNQVFTFIVSLGILEHYDPNLTNALLLFGPPIGGSILLFSGRLRATNRAIRRQTARLMAAVHDALNGFVTIKAFAAEEHVIGAFEAENLDLFGKNLALMRLQAAFNNTMGLVTGSSSAFFLMYGGWQVLHGSISLGTYVLVNGMRNSLFLPFTSFAGLTATYQQAAAGAERIFEYMDKEPSVKDRPGATELPRVDGAIEFRNVVFRYPRDPEPEEESSLRRDWDHSGDVAPMGLLRRATVDEQHPDRSAGNGSGEDGPAVAAQATTGAEAAGRFSRLRRGWARADAPFRSRAGRRRRGMELPQGGDPALPEVPPVVPDVPEEAVRTSAMDSEAIDGEAPDGEAPDSEAPEEDALPPAALDGVSFSIRPGETVGLVGPSGGGKSTVAGLIARFYDCDEGSVRIDGHDLRDVTLLSLRQQIAVVLQDVYLFRATVRDNVAFGLAGATDVEIDAALRAANAQFVWDLPDGPETMVGEGGMRLSGGQRQRVAIARALMRNPRILVLDEATSAQDTLSENAVMETLRERGGNMTILVIAHRLSTIIHADRILVLESGRLVEEGCHTDLLLRGGLYAQLYGAQQEEAGD